MQRNADHALYRFCWEDWLKLVLMVRPVKTCKANFL